MSVFVHQLFQVFEGVSPPELYFRVFYEKWLILFIFTPQSRDSVQPRLSVWGVQAVFL